MKNENIKKVLENARALVAKGWTQGELQKDGRYCTIGALNAASKDSEFWDARFVFNLTIGGNTKIALWNDAPGRTQAEVLEAFDRAIASIA